MAGETELLVSIHIQNAAGGSLSMPRRVRSPGGSTASSSNAETITYSDFAKPWYSPMAHLTLRPDCTFPFLQALTWYYPSLPSNTTMGKCGLCLVRGQAHVGSQAWHAYGQAAECGTCTLSANGKKDRTKSFPKKHNCRGQIHIHRWFGT